MKPEDIYYITSQCNQPVVFKNLIKWKLLSWSLDDWSNILKEEKLPFRKIPFIHTKSPIWERQCETVFLTMKEFIEFQRKDMEAAEEGLYSLYFDYKYMKDYFTRYSEVLNDISWSNLGYAEVTANESTIWIGSRGSHTLCHQDSYGYNLIAQVFGRKEWILFPPETNLYPTRVPYEESSVFSKINFFCPDSELFEDIVGAKRVVLEPGEVLFLPQGWWHYVENLETAISINTWIPTDIDHKKRIEEGLISVFVQGLAKGSSLESSTLKTNYLLNPNSDFLIQENMNYTLQCLQNALELYTKNKHEERDSKMLDFDIKEYVTENNNIELIPTMSIGDLKTIMEEKTTRYKFFQDINNSFVITDQERILEEIVNSFCNPNNIVQVADSYIKNNILM